MEKIKTGIYIKESSKKNLDLLKRHDIKPNDFFDKILSFNKEGLLTYIELITKYQNMNSGFILEENGVYCTNNKEEFEKITNFLKINENEIAVRKNVNDILNKNLEKKLNKVELDDKIELLKTHNTNISNLLIAVSKLIDENEAIKKRIENLEKLN